MVNVIHEAEFGQVKACAAAVVDFSATWCGPCKMLAPVLEKISEEMKGKVDFFKADVDKNPNLARQFAIQSIPALIFLKNGEEVGREIGFKPEAAVKSALQRVFD